MVETLDGVIDRLIAALDWADVFEMNIIVFTSANGPYFIPNKKHLPADFHKVPAVVPFPPASRVSPGDWKMARRYCDNADKSYGYKLYDLTMDPGERYNLSTSEVAWVKDLSSGIDSHLKNAVGTHSR